MKNFDIPPFYRSHLISLIKAARAAQDARKQDFTPTTLDFGPVRFHIARHFGFCYGVENAIETSYRAIEENPDKRIFLLSQMIHNPEVNSDLESRGIRFLMSTAGEQLIDWSELTANDILMIPAFGTTLAIEDKLTAIGLDIKKYNTTCPFVERVWKKSNNLGADKYTILLHGKYNHEETRATFSRSEQDAASIILLDIAEARLIGDVIQGRMDQASFMERFKGRFSAGFDPARDLQRIGVINQTTMLATETQEIADYMRQVMIEKYGEADIKNHFSDTRDTLCYATNENQQATYGLLKQQADLALVVGGYNSSNTSHLVELCEEKLPTYYISSEREIQSAKEIRHFNFHTHELLSTANYLPAKSPVDILLTSGASCPDAVVENVLLKVLSYFENTRPIDELAEEMRAVLPKK